MAGVRGVYDVAVVGAGPAGAATATHLARAGCRVALLDKAAFPRDKPCAECLSAAIPPLLAELGVLDEIEATRPARRRGFRVYAPDGRGFRGDFAAVRPRDGACPVEYGLAVPRRVLDAALVRAATRSGAELREGWRVDRLVRDGADGEWSLTSAAGETLRARLLVGADGVHSTVARRLGLSVPMRRRMIGLVAHLRGIAGLTEYVEMHVAQRRYVGLAPLEADGDLCNVAMVVDEARDGPLLAGRPREFLLEALETFPRLRGRLAGATVARKTLAVSRLSVRARRLSGAGVLLVGDAAGYYDPFTGEGIYRGLRQAQLARDAALAALASGNPGAAALARYDRLCRRELRGKRLIERLIQSAVQVPPLMDHVAAVLARRKAMADAIVGVTGDLLPPSAVLNPGYLLRLLM
jgi:flavin-dependent dehydrogenase